MNIEIRRATISDVHALTEFYRTAIIDTYTGLVPTRVIDCFSKDFLLKEWTEYVEEQKGIAIVLFINGILSGFCASTKSDFDGIDVRLESIYVARALKGKGYGSLLFTNLVDEFQRLGYKSLCLYVLESNDGAREYYKRLGGTEAENPVERNYFDETLYSFIFTWTDLVALKSRLNRIVATR